MPKRKLTGVVVSAKSDKTISVKVERSVMNTRYRKMVLKHKKYAVHDAENQCKVGDVVMIIESKPISKTKKWAVVN